MIIGGYTFAGYKYCVDGTKNDIQRSNALTLQSGIFDAIYISQNTNREYESEFPEGWDYDTIMRALFHGNLLAGNIEYIISNIDKVVIKRRRAGTYNWIDMFEIPIKTSSDFKFERYDRYCANGVEYQYALVPIMGAVEGNIEPSNIKSEFDGLFIMEKEQGYNTQLEINRGEIARNREREVITTLSGKYCYIVRNGDTNYASGQLTAMFLPMDERRDYTTKGAVEYRKEFMDFLTDDQPKILKFTNGQMWMISVVGSPIDEYEEYVEDAVRTTFEWVEIGDPESQQDLYYNNFIDVIS